MGGDGEVNMSEQNAKKTLDAFYDVGLVLKDSVLDATTEMVLVSAKRFEGLQKIRKAAETILEIWLDDKPYCPLDELRSLEKVIDEYYGVEAMEK